MTEKEPRKPRQPNLDSVTTINEDGSRYFLHPADVRGRWALFRKVFMLVLIAVYVLLPWIPVNGHPAVFFDIEKRLFHVFGLTLVPQDLWVLFFGITGLGFALFFVTALLGRLWCGWACPYTVFLDFIYRRIERWIDGDAPARRKLDAAPWGADKIIRRIIKHGLYLLVSALIAHVFLSYFVSLPRLYSFMMEGPLQHSLAFGTMAVLTLLLWFCFAWFREQFCVIMCPYGRIQSVLTDDDTVVIGYDEKRGEPRGHVKDPEAGHCIDCRRCVQVCPTGIDIRNGLQLECIGCTACIDACDEIMDKVGRPRGLVRYDSMNALAGMPRRFLRPRILAYGVLGLIGLGVLGLTAFKRARPYTTTVTRMAGAPYYSDQAMVRNIYQLRILNKRNQTAVFSVELGPDTPPGFSLSGAGQDFQIDALGEQTRPCVVFCTAASYPGATDLTLLITGNPGDVKIEQNIRFLGPEPVVMGR